MIEESFQYSSQNKFDIDFYPLVNKDNWENNLIIIDQTTNKTVAHIGILPRNIIHKGSTFKIGLLGGIATNKNYRGKGLFDTLLKHLFKKHFNEVSLFVLWSDLIDLYGKYGFVAAGDQLETNCSSDQLPDEIKDKYLKTSFQELDEKDRDQIKNLYNEITCSEFMTIERDSRSWDEIAKISSADLYIDKNCSGEISSYFLVNKGFDLKNVIHEFGHTNRCRKKVIELLSRGKLWIPGLSCSLDKDNITQTYTALFKPGNIDKFNELVDYMTDHQVIIKSISNQNTQILQDMEEYTILTSEFLQHLFGPHYIKGLAMPLAPIYITGCDSI